MLRPRRLPAGVLRALVLSAERTDLFVGVENAGRSIMAEAIFNADPPPGWKAVSAATPPPPGAVGLSTYVIGPFTGSSLNPARTIAPAVLSGTYTDLWVYLVAVPLAAAGVAALWRAPRRARPVPEARSDVGAPVERLAPTG